MKLDEKQEKELETKEMINIRKEIEMAEKCAENEVRKICNYI
jgi:hypothetical protein